MWRLSSIESLDATILLHVLGSSRLAPKGWNRQNIEIILETQVIEGRSEAARIAAVHLW